MTDDLRDLLARAGRDEASAARREDFHGAFGDAVRGRVKRRRAVRAAGVGSVAAVSVGAIAFGAVRLPGMPDAGPLGAADCPPGTVAAPVSDGPGAALPEPGVEPTAHAIDVTSERDRETWLLYDDVAQEVALEVAVVREGVIEVTEPGGEPYRVQPNEELRNFVFEAPSGGWVTFSPGTMPALDWSLDAPVEVMFDGSTYTVSSASGASAELFVEDGVLNVREPGGSSAVRAQDGVYTLELSDGVVVNAELDRDSGGLIAWTDGDSTASGTVGVTDAESGFVCVTPEPSPTPSAGATSVPSPEPSREIDSDPSPAPSPSLSADPAGASSPYQCGYVFESEEYGTDEWAVTNAEWRDGDEVWSMLDEWYVDPLASFLVEPRGPVATFNADGSFFDSRGLSTGRGGLGTDAGDGIFDDVWHYEGMGSQSLTFVAALDGQVIAVADPAPQPSGMVVDSNDAQVPTSAFLLDAAALEPCPGVSREEVAEADIVAVSAAAARDRGGDIQVQYVWQTLGRP